MNSPLRRIERSIEPASTWSADHRSIGFILWQLLTTIEIKPVPPPTVPEDLATLPTLLRIHACVRLFLLDIEQSLSPGGQLRGLARLACRISIAIAIIASCAAAALACVAVVVTIAAIITGQLVLLVWNLLQAALLLLALLAVATVLFLAVGFLARQGKSVPGEAASRQRR